eukprot:5447791-Ditylum_brightwellii.AAC.1
MKTVPMASKRSNPDVKQAIILFPRPEPRNLERGQFHTYKLRTIPMDATLPVYELSVPFINEGTPEEGIKFQRGLTAVLKRHNITLGPASYAVAKTLLEGNALIVFEQAEITRGNQTVPHFNKCLDDIAEHVFLDKSGSDSETVYAEKFTIHQGPHREGMGSPITGTERVPQGFSGA